MELKSVRKIAVPHLLQLRKNLEVLKSVQVLRQTAQPYSERRPLIRMYWCVVAKRDNRWTNKALGRKKITVNCLRKKICVAEEDLHNNANSEKIYQINWWKALFLLSGWVGLVLRLDFKSKDRATCRSSILPPRRYFFFLLFNFFSIFYMF